MDILNVVLAAVSSGLLATIITLLVQRKTDEKKIKVVIFETLMSHRYLISDKENVEALNKVEVVFYNDKNVRLAWKEFLEETEKNKKISSESVVNDKYLKLLEKIAKSIGYKKIDWENIKRFYFPIGLSQKMNEETMLRKAQLSQAGAYSIQDSVNGKTTNEQIAIQLMLKALETPNGIEKIAKLVEMGNKNNKR